MIDGGPVGRPSSLKEARMGMSSGIDSAWERLAAASDGSPPRFDPGTLGSVPGPASRWLGRVLPEGVPLSTAAVVTMDGEILIGPRWFRFTARQILRAGVGLVWRPIIGGRFVRFTGADILYGDVASTEFRFHGLIPVARSSGPDTSRSTAGRLAAETVAWLPQAVTPQAGARWTSLDEDRASVQLQVAGQAFDVEVTVDSVGRLRALELQRWNAAARPPRLQPFGSRIVDEHPAASGVKVAGAGAVGWDVGAPVGGGGEFFRFDVRSVEWLG